MTYIFFPDNTFLVSLGHIERVDLLESLPSRMWSATVKSECLRSSHVEGLAHLEQVPDYMGPPLFPTKPELQQTRIFKDRLATPGDDAQAHLGEAETLAIVTSRGLDAVFVTDDKGAALLAGAHSIPVATTWRVLRLLHRSRRLERAEMHRALGVLRQAGRRAPECGWRQEDFDLWLSE